MYGDGSYGRCYYNRAQEFKENRFVTITATATKSVYCIALHCIAIHWYTYIYEKFATPLAC